MLLFGGIYDFNRSRHVTLDQWNECISVVLQIHTCNTWPMKWMHFDRVYNIIYYEIWEKKIEYWWNSYRVRYTFSFCLLLYRLSQICACVWVMYCTFDSFWLEFLLDNHLALKASMMTVSKAVFLKSGMKSWLGKGGLELYIELLVHVYVKAVSVVNLAEHLSWLNWIIMNLRKVGYLVTSLLLYTKDIYLLTIRLLTFFWDEGLVLLEAVLFVSVLWNQILW